MKTEITYEPGDVVRSLAGGPPLVVERINDVGELVCSYWDGSKRFRMFVSPLACVRPATEAELDLCRTRL